MKTLASIRGLAAVAACAWLFGLAAAPAMAGDLIPGVDVNLGKNPGGALHAATDSDSNVAFPKLAPGNYTLKIDGKAFAAPTDGSKTDCMQVSVFVGDDASSPKHSIQAPMCPETAKQGMQLTFDLPKGGTVRVLIVRLTNVRAFATAKTQSTQGALAPGKGADITTARQFPSPKYFAGAFVVLGAILVVTGGDNKSTASTGSK